MFSLKALACKSSVSCDLNSVHTFSHLNNKLGTKKWSILLELWIIDDYVYHTYIYASLASGRADPFVIISFIGVNHV